MRPALQQRAFPCVIAGLRDYAEFIPLKRDLFDLVIISADALVCINMIHISPWAVSEGLMAGARRVLRMGGVIDLYGPYKIDGRHTAQSNKEFDAWLRTQNAHWGVRDLADMADLAARNDFVLIETVPMPANNLSIIFKRDG